MDLIETKNKLIELSDISDIYFEQYILYTSTYLIKVKLFDKRTEN